MAKIQAYADPLPLRHSVTTDVIPAYGHPHKREKPVGKAA